jgi:hypothetical protein
MLIAKCIVILKRAYCGLYPKRIADSDDFKIVCGGCTVEQTATCDNLGCVKCRSGSQIKLHKNFCNLFYECTNKIIVGPGVVVYGVSMQFTVRVWYGIVKKLLFGDTPCSVSKIFTAITQCYLHHNKFKSNKCLLGQCTCGHDVTLSKCQYKPRRVSVKRSGTSFHIWSRTKRLSTCSKTGEPICLREGVQLVCPYATYKHLNVSNFNGAEIFVPVEHLNVNTCSELKVS